MSETELSKSYEPKEIEEKWARIWTESGVNTPEPDSKKPPFSMVIPPPNITGALHIGHALNVTLQDALARYKRMKGFNVLWLPGIDHAGIATQNVVERQIAEEGLDRHKVGRDEFVERVWRWKEKSGGVIIAQFKRLGASCDWTRLRFTMDEGLSKAVREVFVRLYDEGLIYRGDYIINWCPRCHTALSDLEVQSEEKEGSLWHIEYPLVEPTPEIKSMIVATTRPETMLGDAAVAVNPDDGRYKNVIGRMLKLPLTDREIPVIADASVAAEFGTGAVKITPAHDFNDFDVASRHNLPHIRVMDVNARMNENAGAFAGMDRFGARKKIVAALEGQGLLAKIDKHKLMLGGCYRCSTVVEPTLSKQWFVKTAPLAGPAIKAVEDGAIRFVPKGWENTYFDWMRNIRDWCISRQIWWGHRIPAWHCAGCGAVTVSISDPVKCGKCSSPEITQDPDVLDTWFSSALWPFSTLGWPEKTVELKTYYPTSALSTSFDIIFFWVARMIMMGMKFMDAPPFKDVYIHALVRDAQGQKMSKSKGNVIDPLLMFEQYGTDAFRFTLAILAAQGRDIKLSDERIAGNRNFCNKIWNLTRFILMNVDGNSGGSVDGLNLNTADKWILTRLSVCAKETSDAIEDYRFDEAARSLYRFVWHELCDWYVELVKLDLRGENGLERKTVAQRVMVAVFKDTLKLLHPFMPFITDELYTYLPGAQKAVTLMTLPYPAVNGFPSEAVDMELAMDVIRAVRNIRTEMNVALGAMVECVCIAPDPAVRENLKANEGYIKLLAKAGSLIVREPGVQPPPKSAAFGRASEGGRGVEVYVPLEGCIDLDVETSRLSKELAKAGAELESVEKRLSSEAFSAKAPPEVVEKERERLVGLREKIAKLAASIERLKGGAPPSGGAPTSGMKG